MNEATKLLLLPNEPDEIRDHTRATLEDSPETGSRVVNDAAFIADYFWEEWGETLETSDLDYDRFLDIARGYAGESRLWVVGERPWDHFAAGLAGRVVRRSNLATNLADGERMAASVSEVRA